MANVRKVMADAEAKRLDAPLPSKRSPVSVDDPFGLRAAAGKLPHTPMPQAKPAQPQPNLLERLAALARRPAGPQAPPVSGRAWARTGASLFSDPI